jgi:hypothetical protein
LLGRARLVEQDADPAILEKLSVPDYKAKVERGFIIAVEAFDWNCPQHITQRFTAAEVDSAILPLKMRLTELEAELSALKR